MKKSLYLFFLLFNFFLKEAKCQFAIAGIPGAKYVDIVPDTVLNNIVSSGSNIMNYNIDINQDGASDIEIKASAGISPGGSNQNIFIKSLNTFTSFAFGSRDSTLSAPVGTSCSQWVARTILKKINLGDTIKNDVYVPEGYLTYLSYNHCPYNVMSAQWDKASNSFFGVKYQTASDTSYGWVHIDVPEFYKVRVKEYSLGNFSGVGINSKLEINNSISVFPNPAKESIKIKRESKESAELIITDVMGRIVLEKILIQENTSIDIRDLQNGAYFVRIKTSEGISIRKIIVQK